MAFNIIVRDEVWADVQAAIEWYESKTTGLGERFFTSFEKTFAEIVKNPDHYLYITKNVRRSTIAKFPYSIHYIKKDNTLVVLGVIHRKRSNAFLRKRFRGQ